MSLKITGTQKPNTMDKAEQCQWCYEHPGSRFRLNSAFTEIAKGQRIECANYNGIGGIMETPLVTEK